MLSVQQVAPKSMLVLNLMPPSWSFVWVVKLRASPFDSWVTLTGSVTGPNPLYLRGMWRTRRTKTKSSKMCAKNVRKEQTSQRQMKQVYDVTYLLSLHWHPSSIHVETRWHPEHYSNLWLHQFQTGVYRNIRTISRYICDTFSSFFPFKYFMSQCGHL